MSVDPSGSPADPAGGSAPRLSAWRAVVGSFGVAGLMGIPLGIGWWLLAPRIRVEVTQAGAVFAPGNPSDWFGREGWFGVLGLLLGAVAGVLAHRWWGRRPVPALLGVTLGGLLAALLGYQLGRLLGPGALPRDVSSLPEGTVIGAPLRIIAPAVFLAVSFAAVLAFGVAVALERDADPPAARTSSPDDVPSGSGEAGNGQPRDGETGTSDPALAR